ncbi:MAG TPA: hypothetical protein VEO01_29640 [Pseudonocardiaceae bacterium]|nr:hypothetical protein [Pseudonocardiaceae bacterium]
MHVSALLEIDGAQARLLRTVRGLGYVLHTEILVDRRTPRSKV